MLAALLATACSFQQMARPEPPRSEDDCVPLRLAVIDGVVAVVAGVAAIVLFANNNEPPPNMEGQLRDSEGAGLLVASLGAGFALSSASAFALRHECMLDVAAYQQQLRDQEAAEQARARVEAASLRERQQREARRSARAGMTRAAAAARAGDCPTVVAVDRDVAASDREFHDSVFARDVAIARCLEPRAQDQ